MLKEYIRRLKEEEKRVSYYHARVGEYHASELNPNHCLNAKWRNFRTALEKSKEGWLTDETRLRMRVGKLIHMDIQRFYSQTECVGSLQIMDFKIVGRVDILEEKHIIELKTYDRKDKELPNKPEFDHICQVNLYMEMFKRNRANLVYINHWLCKEKVFEIYKDSRLVQEIIAYTAILHQYLKLGIEPPHNDKCRCRKGGGSS